MGTSPIEIIQHAKDLLGYRADWFDTLAEWYENLQLTRRLLSAIWEQNQLRCSHALIVNGDSVPRRASTVERHERVTWLVPTAYLRAGTNHLLVWATREEDRPLLVRGLVAEQLRVAPPQRLDLTVAQPSTKGPLQLTVAHAARHSGECWSVAAGGFVGCSLHLPTNRELSLTVELLPHQGSELLETLEDVYEKVRDFLEKQIDAREAAKGWFGKDDPLGAGQQAKELEELRSYSWLHKTQIADALQAPPSMSLGEVLDKLGAPRPTARLYTGPTTQAPPAPQPTYTYPPAPVNAATTVQPLAPVQPLPQVQPLTPQGGPSMVGCFFALVVLVGLNVGGYVAWQSRADIQAWWQRTFASSSQTQRKREFDERVKKFGGQAGEVQVTLRWDNKNDLDLHVVPPNEPDLFFGNRRSASGGVFDIDKNVGYAGAVMDPVENIHWPEGKAPGGKYQVYVVHFSNHRQPDCQDPTRYAVRVVVRGQEQYFDGEVTFNPQRPRILVAEFHVDGRENQPPLNDKKQEERKQEERKQEERKQEDKK